MIQGDGRLRALVERGVIDGTDERLINPASVNLRLGHTYLRPLPGEVTLGGEMAYERAELAAGETIVLEPGGFMLATTLECVDLPRSLAAFVQGRSSIGRIGLTVQNAGFIDPGFRGHITLELKNDSPCRIRLFAGYPVAQLVLMDAVYVSRGYEGKYVDQVEATGSRMRLDGITPENAEVSP